MVFVQKWPFFQLFLLGNIGQEKFSYDILEQKNGSLCFKNKILKKSKKWHFSKGVNPWFWSKNFHFSKLSFLGNIGQENVFYDILERKNTCLGNKNKMLKKSKNCNFSKGVNPCFSSKNGHFFQLFFLGNIGKENFFYNILERKISFLGYKNNKFKKSKKSHFYKGVNSWFLFKNDHYSNLFLLAI